MSFDSLHQEIIKHYRTKSMSKDQRNIKKQSIIRQSYIKKGNDQEKHSTFEDFLKNEQKIASESQPLYFRQLPRNLKVYFPGPPSPLPKLNEIPYTYEIVPKVPYRMPKQKKGIAADWVLDQSYFLQSSTHKSKELMKKQRVTNHQSTDLGARFRNVVKRLANTMKEQNLSLEEIIANKGLIKKPYNFYNSQQFFTLIKKADKDALRLLEENPYLAFDIDDLKMTPLHWAARAGYAELVNILTTKYRANPSAKDSYGRTPLHLAVAKKNTECIIRIFIEGGKFTALNNSKQSVKSIAPDVYTKFLIEKLEQIKFVVRGKGIKDQKFFKTELQKNIRESLDSSTLYF